MSSLTEQHEVRQQQATQHTHFVILTWIIEGLGVSVQRVSEQHAQYFYATTRGVSQHWRRRQLSCPGSLIFPRWSWLSVGAGGQGRQSLGGSWSGGVLFAFAGTSPSECLWKIHQELLPLPAQYFTQARLPRKVITAPNRTYKEGERERETAPGSTVALDVLNDVIAGQ